MFRSIRIPATALVASLAIAIGTMGATTTAARADGDDAARILGGLLALYAISRVIENGRDNRNAQVHRNPPPAYSNNRPHNGNQNGYGHRPRPQHLVAPARCYIEGSDHGQRYRGYVRRCMQNSVARPNLLPSNCLRLVQTQRGQRQIYGGRCLAQNGWVRG
ncbi:MAG: hypothetical protein RIB61_14120 [Roseicyclus sp.]